MRQLCGAGLVYDHNNEARREHIDVTIHAFRNIHFYLR